MSSSNKSSDGWRSVMVRKNPVPPGTTYSVVLPWVSDSATNPFVAHIFNKLGWATILDIHMIYKKEMPPREKGGRPKPAHYTVFIHFGGRNPDLAMVFDYLSLDKKNELKVYYNEKYFWKVRCSTWKPDPRNDIRVDFGSSSCAVPKSVTPEDGPAGLVMLTEEEYQAALKVSGQEA